MALLEHRRFRLQQPEVLDAVRFKKRRLADEHLSALDVAADASPGGGFKTVDCCRLEVAPCGMWIYARLPNGGIAMQYDIETPCIGGTSDHAHLLLSLPTSLSVAKAIKVLSGLNRLAGRGSAAEAREVQQAGGLPVGFLNPFNDARWVQVNTRARSRRCR